MRVKLQRVMGKVGMDGGDVRQWCAKQHHCEVMVGQSPQSCGEAQDDTAPSSKRLGVVPPLETKPKRRREEVWHAQGTCPRRFPCARTAMTHGGSFSWR